MFKIFIIADKKEPVRGLSAELIENGFFCSIGSGDNESTENITSQPPDLVLVAVGDAPPDSEKRLLPQRIREETGLPVIALVSINSLELVADPSVDDFVVEPWQANEVIARAKRILQRTCSPASKEPITSGDLTIDPVRHEVTSGGRLVELTFREYELLAFLASNRGKVFSREALLHTVWDVDYYGGGRTVDVHVRRLRSKCGDSCVETVRNVGYRFRDD